MCQILNPLKSCNFLHKCSGKFKKKLDLKTLEIYKAKQKVKGKRNSKRKQTKIQKTKRQKIIFVN